MKAIITVGIPASGKTTWAKEFCRVRGAVNVNRDDIRFSVTGHSSWSEYRFTQEREELVTKIQRDIIRNAASNGKNVVISDTNLNKKFRKELVDFVRGLGYEVEFKEFPIKLEEAYARDSSRENGVGNEVIYRMWLQWLEYKGEPKYQGTNGKDRAVIVDVDGTVALMKGRRPYDWDKVITDIPRVEVMCMVGGLYSAGYVPVFLSGRDSICRDDTAKWLGEHFGDSFSEDRLFMRDISDMRPDTVVKKEIFWRDVAPNWNVTTAIDDRPCMVRTWYEIGIKNVIAVANPYIEF